MTKDIDELENLIKGLDTLEESFEQVAELEKQVRDTEAKVLSEILDRIAGLCDHIGEEVETYYYHAGEQFSNAKTEFSDEKAIHIISIYEEGNKYEIGGSKAPYRHRGGDQNRGWYDGISYYLFPDGAIKKMVWSGDWSCWQGEGSGYEATKIEETDTLEMMETVGDEKVLEKILKSLKKEITQAKKDKENKQKYIGKRKKLIETVEAVLDL